MNLHPVLADSGRPGASNNVSLLNAGWSFTTATPLPPPDEGWALPAQALCIFIEAEWSELNRPHNVILELVNEDGALAKLMQGPEPTDARISCPMTVPSVAGAPNGTPGRAHFLVDLPAGAIRVAHAPGRFTWRVAVGEAQAEIGFWVHVPAAQPKIG